MARNVRQQSVWFPRGRAGRGEQPRRQYEDRPDAGHAHHSSLILPWISASFFWVLSNAFHNRIDYPGFDFNRRSAG